jgi:hypothetical protein
LLKQPDKQDLTNEKKLAPGSVLIAVAALRFLYKVFFEERLAV